MIEFFFNGFIVSVLADKQTPEKQMFGILWGFLGVLILRNN
jgi:hypothetical protein